MKNKLLIMINLIASLYAIPSIAEEQPANWLKVDTIYEAWDNGTYRYGTNEQFGHKFNDWFSLDVKQLYRFNPISGTTMNRIESAPTFRYKLDNWNISLRTGVGERFLNSKTNHYFTVEPGVSYKLTPDLSLRATYRFRHDFETALIDKSMRESSDAMFFGADYNVTSNTYLSLGYGRSSGSQAFNSASLGVGVKF